MIRLIVFMCIILLIFINRRYIAENYKVLNPLSLFLYVWLFVLIMHSVSFDKTEYTDWTYLLILLGIFSFTIAFWISSRCIMKSWSGEYRTYNFDFVLRLIKWLTVIEIIRVINFSIIVFRLAGSISTFIERNTYVRNLYLAYSGGTFESILNFILNANAMIGYVLIGIYIANQRNRRGVFYLIIWSICEVAIAIVTMSKMCLVIFILVIVITAVNNIDSIWEQKRIIKKYLPFILVGLFGFLLIIGIQRNYSEIGDSFIETVIIKAMYYFDAGVEALGKYMSSYDGELGMGYNTFRFISRIFSRLGLWSNDAVLQHDESIILSFGETNIYTWFKTFFIDFSYAGFFVGPFLWGIIIGLFYNPPLKNLFLDVCTSWLSAILVMTFYAYMWGQTIYIFVLVYAFILHNIFMDKLYVADT